MSEIYGTNIIPSDYVTVQSGGTVAVGVATARTAGIIGGMDTGNGSATAGDVVTITTPTQADNQFGADSELAQQIRLIFANGPVNTIYAVGVTETEETETLTAVSEATLSNVPLFDPNVNPEHEVTIQDTTEAATVDVEYDYTSPPAAPTTANTAAVNPTTGEVAFDESSDYDVTYEYGDYSSAITELLPQAPRFVGICTENESVLSEFVTEVNTYDVDFDFMHGIGGAGVAIDSSTYSNTFDERRLGVVAASRGFLDAAETEEVRTVGAVVGKQASKELGDSTTYESLTGLLSLKTTFQNNEVADLIDGGVLPLKRISGGVKIVNDTTTSSDPQFNRFYVSEITDEATEISHVISQSFIGRANTRENRILLQTNHEEAYDGMESDALLDDYTIGVAEDASDDDAVNVTIGLDVVDVMDNINVEITVGDVIVNGGAS
jgi:hypothetical protein